MHHEEPRLHWQHLAFKTTTHRVLDTQFIPPFATALETVVLGMGCYWGAEKLFWRCTGIYTTAVGFAAGHTAEPTYKQVCAGNTGHAETVLVVFDPTRVSFDHLLDLFWKNHDPTQGMRQGADIGTQYRSLILTCNDAQQQVASASLLAQQRQTNGPMNITTDLLPLTDFYYAEPEHQQYLDTHPQGYCHIQFND